MTTAAEITRVYVSAANSVAFGGGKATQSRDEIDLQICTNTTAISDTYCWLGREESNLRMAESKSEQFSFLIKGHSEKIAIFSPNSINRLGRVSECRLEGFGR